MPWIIENFKPFEKNTLRGFFSLNVSGMSIEGFTYHQKGGKRWVGLPAREYTNDDGESGWWPMVNFKDKGRQEAFQKWAKAEVKKIMPAVEEEAPLEDDGLPF